MLDSVRLLVFYQRGKMLGQQQELRYFSEAMIKVEEQSLDRSTHLAVKGWITLVGFEEDSYVAVILSAGNEAVISGTTL